MRIFIEDFYAPQDCRYVDIDDEHGLENFKESIEKIYPEIPTDLILVSCNGCIIPLFSGENLCDFSLSEMGLGDGAKINISLKLRGGDKRWMHRFGRKFFSTNRSVFIEDNSNSRLLGLLYAKKVLCNTVNGFKNFWGGISQFYNPFVGLSWWFVPVAVNLYGFYKFRHKEFYLNKPVLDMPTKDEAQHEG